MKDRANISEQRRRVIECFKELFDQKKHHSQHKSHKRELFNHFFLFLLLFIVVENFFVNVFLFDFLN